MPFIVPTVTRFTIHGTFAGREIANVIDQQITPAIELSRPDAIAAIAAKVLDGWADSIITQVVNDYQFTSVSWVDLDAVDGSVGQITSTANNALPQSGLITTDPMPANVAALVTKNTVALRNQRQGRLYLVGMAEGDTLANTPNTLSGTKLTLLQQVFNDFKVTAEEQDITTPNASQIVVVHIVTRDAEGNPATGTFSDMTSFGVQATLATQRRRLRG